jgi:signal transduction histidine kinase
LRIAVEADADCIWLRVENNGTPIPAEMVPHLYDPYYPVREGVQTGLGLYMAKLIVESHHGGTLEVESDKVNRFSCCLPRGKP